MKRLEFHTADYIVMAIFVAISSAIGIYYGFYKKQRTTEEYILGNRQIHFVPVALSLAVTFQSAVSIIGSPSEIYLYNTMVAYTFLGLSIAYLIQAFFIVPLVHPLRLTSAYEYLQRRFQSRAVQLLGMTMGMLQTLLYVSIVLYSPALALEAVAGIPVWLSIVIIGLIGTVYTAIGGMRTVIWTDTFQFVLIYGGLAVILILSVKEIGSLSKVFSLSSEGGRIKFDEINPDPRVRHTVWGCVIGAAFSMLPNCCSQSSIQRISSIEKAKDAKYATLLNIPLAITFHSILILTGLVLYAYFVIKACDPLAGDQVSNPNQLMIYFVLNVLSDVPGLAGIFLAAVFSGALSTLSSGINSMATNALQDILSGYLQEAQQIKKTFILKLLVLVYGIVTVVLAYLSQYLTGPVTQMCNTAFGAAGGPIVGIFFLGAVFPQANKKGAFIGGMCGIAINMWIALGSFLYGNKAPLSTPVATSGCYQNETDLLEMNVTLPTGSSTFDISFDRHGNNTTTMEFLDYHHSTDNHHLAIYDLSYVWLGFIGFLIAIIIGLVVSFITGKDKDFPTDPMYIIPLLRHVWAFDDSTLHGQPKSEYCFVPTDEEMEVIDPKKKNIVEPIN
ncbi:sodium-coupled monocarboxylate transporter 1-like [Mercenaria mercenaria]|uniref:sodium-coupled monocarboxylate transporter 1-like n=1 Tax=Mercenaria mercenaria TaxID=6596 RepID=UPI00234EAC26|nr:sodium-coupled monocarboxylate transporter 1-like [Mercenaria mercenaria]